MTPALLLALAAAQPGMSAEEAIAAQRAELRSALRLDCPPGAAGDDIVVCGRSREAERQRLPLPSRVEPGARTRLPGEPPTGMDALNADSSRCTTVGRAQSCGGVDFLGAGIMIIREIVKGIERRRD